MPEIVDTFVRAKTRFNGDGKSDILLRDTSGNVAIWLMNGAQVTQFVGVGTVPSAWTIVGTGDFNGDGKSDILWHDTSGVAKDCGEFRPRHWTNSYQRREASATRYDKLARNYFSSLCLVAAVVFWL
jgi:hypothetical protein